ncbi:hypothetical protein N182_34880 [Sinorhizobium sp. GL2]|nr:hypothetical protein N182_34880 [Sinorhizobium sp. GL2]
MSQADLCTAAKSKGRKGTTGNGQKCATVKAGRGGASLAAAGSQAAAGTAKRKEGAAQ